MDSGKSDTFTFYIKPRLVMYLLICYLYVETNNICNDVMVRIK